MALELPSLPYEKSALEPFFSRETVEFHYDKHHQALVKNLNDLLLGTEYENMSLDAIVEKSSGRIFYHAAFVWNHSFYWQSLSPHGGGEPRGALADAIGTSFGSFSVFKEEFTQCALSTFGKGWTWLVKNADGSLAVVTTVETGFPLTVGQIPLLTCAVWEYAYFIDYRYAKLKYLYAFWALINWHFVVSNYTAAGPAHKPAVWTM
ncbi:MAG: superoxide dismutase [Gammaproteobacteria bacterium]